MKQFGFLVFGILWAVATAQQLPFGESLNRESKEALEELRLQRTKRYVTEQQSFDAATAKRLMQIQDRQVIEAALRDQSTDSSQSLEKKTRARLILSDVVRLAGDEDIKRGLVDAGVDEGKVIESARTSKDPVNDLHQLSSKLGIDEQGRTIVAKIGVKIYHPIENAPDSCKPGDAEGDGRVCRPGLLYAVAIGTSDKRLICSGTIVAKYWVLTAAHCLWDDGRKRRLGPSEIWVFLPFQFGQETLDSAQGYRNKNLRKVVVEDATWIGDENKEQFPTNPSGISSMIYKGQDLALLRLRQADVDELPVRINDVALYKGAPPNPPLSIIGYGMTTGTVSADLTLMVGVRDTRPYGVEKGENLLIFGVVSSNNQHDGGICTGDSGGGLFAGRVDGNSQKKPELIALASGYLSSSLSTSDEICIAHQQGYTSLISEANRKFVCGRIPQACN